MLFFRRTNMVYNEDREMKKENRMWLYDFTMLIIVNTIVRLIIGMIGGDT